MKTKKAVRQLNKIEVLLSNIIDQFSGGKEALGELLDSAKADVIRAKETMNSQVSTNPAKNSTAKTETAHPRRPTADGSKRTSLEARKRALVAKRKGMNAATGQRSSKTA